jgi:hypothetical protein
VAVPQTEADVAAINPLSTAEVEEGTDPDPDDIDNEDEEDEKEEEPVISNLIWQRSTSSRAIHTSTISISICLLLKNVSRGLRECYGLLMAHVDRTELYAVEDPSVRRLVAALKIHPSFTFSTTLKRWLAKESPSGRRPSISNANA